MININELMYIVVFFKQKTAYELRISDWSSDVCSSDLARLLIEPQIAREAALNATAGDIAELKQSMFASRHAQTWRQYENSDNRLHRTVAEAAHNTVLLALFDTLNAVRRAVVWGRLRDKIDRPPPDQIGRAHV